MQADGACSMAARDRDVASSGRSASAYERSIDALGLLAAIGLLLMPVLITADVLMRLVRAGNIKWVVDVCEYILFASTFIGAPWLLRLGQHVRVDVFLLFMPKAIARRVEQGLDALCALICAVLAWYGVLATLEAYTLGLKQYKTLTVPDWPFQALFVFALALMMVEFIKRMARPDQALETPDLTTGV